jgi:Protein of unknown function (DUF3352)
MTKKRGLRVALVAAGCAAVSVAAGCGGSTQGKAGGGIGAPGAALVTSGALAYVSIDSNLSSSRWQQLNKLLDKFPIRDRLLTKLKDELAKKGVNYERDVKPALGDEVDVAVAAGAAGQAPSYIYFTKPDSIVAAKALVDKLDSAPTATRVVDGWLVVGETDAGIDSVLKGSGSALADDSAFKDGFGSLPDNAIAKAYANGPQLTKLFTSFSGATTAGFGSMPRRVSDYAPQTAAFDSSEQPKLDWVAASLVPEDNGLKLEAHIKSPNAADFTGSAYESKLVSGVPADAIAFLSLHGNSTQNPLSRLRANPTFAEVLAQIERQLGMSLDRVYALFEHEFAIYVRRGPGLPEFSLVLETPDTEQALATIDRLGERVAQFAHARLGTEQQAGLEVKTLNLGRVTVRWAGFDGRVLITTSPTGIDDYRSNGDKLADDSTYKDALDAAGAPAKNLGLIYVNVADLTTLIYNYAGLSGDKIPPDVSENLKPLKSFVAYGAQDGDITNLEAFLEVK